MPRRDPAANQPLVVTVFHEFSSRPGRYVASAVLSDPGATTPRSAIRPAVVAKIPKTLPFLVGPILGRRGVAENEAFEPLLTPEAQRGQVLESLTILCAVGAKEPVDIRQIARVVTTWEGDGAQRFDPVSVRLDGRGPVDCHEVVDRVATDTLAPGRYEISVLAETSTHVAGRGTTEFQILPTATP